MVCAIILFEDKICERGVESLWEIERIAGKECLTKGYAKLQHIVHVCVKIAEASKTSDAATLDASTRSCILYALQAIRFSLKYEILQSKNVTVDQIDDKRDGTPGLIHIILTRMFMLGHVRRAIAGLRGVVDAAPLVAEMDDLLQHFVDYDAFERAFQKGPKGGSAATPLSETAVEDDADTSSADGSDQLDVLLQKYKSKPTHLLANFLFDLMSGTLDDKLRAAVKGEYNLTDVDLSSKDGLDALREWKRALALYQSIVPVESPKPDAPGPGAATPGRDAAALEKAAERSAVWQRAQAKRKSLVVVGHGKITTKQQVQAYYEKCQTVYRFQTKDREAHRVFLFSAELYTDARRAPWTSTAPFEESAKPFLEFMLAQTGVGDVLCFMDGRSRSWRRKFEDLLEAANARNTAEVWIIYKCSEGDKDGVVAARKCSFASENREVALLSMPVARNHLPCKPRSDPCRNAGETSTHNTTYTGVDPLAWKAMQLLSKADKERILGFEPATPKLKGSAATPACPLFWQEKKTHLFWATILNDLGAKAVFDCTPGSGSCARACMDKGIVYACLAKSQQHSAWLQNVLDRAAVTSICTLESALYTQDLATCIKEHLQDIVDQLAEQDGKQKRKKDEDDDDDDGYEFEEAA